MWIKIRPLQRDDLCQRGPEEGGLTRADSSRSADSHVRVVLAPKTCDARGHGCPRSFRPFLESVLVSYSLIPQRGIPIGRLRIACRHGVSAAALLSNSVSGEAVRGATKPVAKNATP